MDREGKISISFTRFNGQRHNGGIKFGSNSDVALIKGYEVKGSRSAFHSSFKQWWLKVLNIYQIQSSWVVGVAPLKIYQKENVILMGRGIICMRLHEGGTGCKRSKKIVKKY
jgi:hypothetical protein